MKYYAKLLQRIISFFIVLGFFTSISAEAKISGPKALQKSAKSSRIKQSSKIQKKGSALKASRSPRRAKIAIKKNPQALSVRNTGAKRTARTSPSKLRTLNKRSIKLVKKPSLIKAKIVKKSVSRVTANKKSTSLKRNVPATKATVHQGQSLAPKSAPKAAIHKNQSLTPNNQQKSYEKSLPILKKQTLGFLDAKLVKISHSILASDYSEGKFNTCDLGFSNQTRTKQYTVLNLPAAPVLHPYNPIDFDAMEEYFLPAYTLNVKLPKLNNSLLPEALQSVLLKELKAGNIKEVEAYVEVQDMPWRAGKNGEVPLLFRPLYWCFPNEPNEKKEAYNNSFAVRVGTFSKMPNSPKIIGQKDTKLVMQELSIHNGGPNTPIVSSGNSLPVNGIIKTQSHAFYSLTIHQNRAAVTKHIILNNTDESEFEKILAQSTTLQDLKGQFEKKRGAFSKPAFVDEFNDLWTVN